MWKQDLSRFDYCTKCRKATVKLKGEGYTRGRHEQIQVNYCKKCGIIYVPKKMKLTQVTVEDIQSDVAYVYGQGPDIPITGKERRQRELGMI